jgi:hypothetical protein
MKTTLRALAIGVLALMWSQAAAAQAPPSPVGGDEAAASVLLTPDPEDSQLRPLAPVAPPVLGRPVDNPFTSVGRDLKNFFSLDTAMIVSSGGFLATVASTKDHVFIIDSKEDLHSGVFEPGNIGGSFLVQTAAAVSVYAVGRATGDQKTASVGADLVRSQFVSQIVVQGVKFSTQRTRPDGSNQQAFPSGHTASAFATATVLNRHLGWKAGLPAYLFATYVGASRMSINKHHLSDVVMGATIGFAAGRSVTFGVGKARFDMSATPTAGGAAVTFTKR